MKANLTIRDEQLFNGKSNNLLLGSCRVKSNNTDKISLVVIIFKYSQAPNKDYVATLVQFKRRHQQEQGSHIMSVVQMSRISCNII